MTYQLHFSLDCLNLGHCWLRETKIIPIYVELLPTVIQGITLDLLKFVEGQQLQAHRTACDVTEECTSCLMKVC